MRQIETCSEGKSDPHFWLQHLFDDHSEITATLYSQVLTLKHFPILKNLVSSNVPIRPESQMHKTTFAEGLNMQNILQMASLEERIIEEYIWNIFALQKHRSNRIFYDDSPAQLFRNRKLFIQELLKGPLPNKHQSSPVQREDMPIHSTGYCIAESWTEDKINIRQSNDLKALAILAETCVERRENKAPYFDASVFSDPIEITSNISNTSREDSVAKSFPEKLYQILIDGHKQGTEESVSFLPHGRAFIM
jgi:hypothetical protein